MTSVIKDLLSAEQYKKLPTPRLQAYYTKRVKNLYADMQCDCCGEPHYYSEKEIKELADYLDAYKLELQNRLFL